MCDLQEVVIACNKRGKQIMSCLSKHRVFFIFQFATNIVFHLKEGWEHGFTDNLAVRSRKLVGITNIRSC